MNPWSGWSCSTTWSGSRDVSHCPVRGWGRAGGGLRRLWSLPGQYRLAGGCPSFVPCKCFQGGRQRNPSHFAYILSKMPVIETIHCPVQGPENARSGTIFCQSLSQSQIGCPQVWEPSRQVCGFFSPHPTPPSLKFLPHQNAPRR